MSIASIGSTFIRPTTRSALVQRAPSSSESQSRPEGASPERAAPSASTANQLNQAGSPSAMPSAVRGASDSEKQNTQDGTIRQAAGEDAGEKQLTGEEQAQVDKLERRDAEVRAHEAAHVSAAGRYATSGANFSYETGPDGRRYAVGGDVSISLSEEQTPEATVAKMEVVIRAAMAPAQPSTQDHRVAAEAAQKKATAQQEAIAAKSETESDSAADGTISDHSESESTGASSTASDFNVTIPSASRSSGFAAIAAKAKTTSAQKAYGGNDAPVSRSMAWTM